MKMAKRTAKGARRVAATEAARAETAGPRTGEIPPAGLFPIGPGPGCGESPLAAWLDTPLGRYDEDVARALCVVATWSYADDKTFAEMLADSAFPPSEVVSVHVENDPLLVNGTARLIQSNDGRMAILAFKGTPPIDKLAWLGNFSVKAEPFYEAGNVHGGFYRTLSVMFSQIEDLLFHAGLLRRGSGLDRVPAQSITAARRAERHALDARPRLDLVRRHRLLESWLHMSGDELRRTIHDSLKAAIEGEEGLEITYDIERAASLSPTDLFGELLTDPVKAAQRVRVMEIGGGVRSFLDAMTATPPEALRAVLERELKKLEETVVEKVVDYTLHQPRRQPLERLYITGHSLGGALAVLAAAALYHAYGTAVLGNVLGGVYTFGQPMVGDEVFARNCDRDFGCRLFRHVFHRDIVPHLPPKTTGCFAHSGTEYRSTPSGWEEQPPGHFSRQTLSLVQNLPTIGLGWVIEQLPVVEGFVHNAPLVNWLTQILPLYSVADHSPLEYLRCSFATRVRAEIMGHLP